MSTVKATNFQNASSATANMVTDASGNVSFGGTAAMSSSFLRNRIINGDMRVDQRNAGAAQTITSGSTPYTVDRWIAYGNGASITSQQVAGTGPFPKALQFTGASSVSQALIRQRIESLNTSDLSGATITIQAYVWGSAAGTVNMTLYYPTVIDNHTSQTTIVDTAFSITTTPTLFTFVVTSLPSGVLNGLEVRFTYGAIGAGVTRTITGVQLEVGTVATPFERQLYNAQLAQCQRYFAKVTAGANYSGFGNGLFSTTTTGGFLSKLSVTMRSSPTVSQSSLAAYDGTNIIALTGLITTNGGTDYINQDFTVASGGTANRAVNILSNNTTSGFLSFSAEL